MTAQILDKIVVNGKEHPLQNFPLEAYFELQNETPFGEVMTCCRRGYLATWELTADGMLYLNGIERFPKSDAPLPEQFDGRGRVFANWFSGVLKIGDGNRVGPDTYSINFERTIEQDICHGRVNGEKKVIVHKRRKSYDPFAPDRPRSPLPSVLSVQGNNGEAEFVSDLNDISQELKRNSIDVLRRLILRAVLDFCLREKRLLRESDSVVIWYDQVVVMASHEVFYMEPEPHIRVPCDHAFIKATVLFTEHADDPSAMEGIALRQGIALASTVTSYIHRRIGEESLVLCADLIKEMRFGDHARNLGDEILEGLFDAYDKSKDVTDEDIEADKLRVQNNIAKSLGSAGRYFLVQLFFVIGLLASAIYLVAR